ncbi:Retrovirus-related Pol polyprotein from transposon TNT 1-94 [Cucumis melo var. makuwa]|uniref:Retrovirus-related Pol polyprotein from transposon TNT 1-94 n=1 Tax=Cucumis melo var. makuwa TaxID=1194695 RepID=A0A5D3CE12_CUCMM|nr:Retrovirus-related Pol polyprotein from transposon TNT 1-94 [Cucumis melo var. makuwa]
MEVCFEVHLEEDHTSFIRIMPTLAIDSTAFNWCTKEQCWKLHGHPLRGKRRSSTDKQSTGRAYVCETASPTTLGAIAQSDIPQSFRLISIDGKNPWILDSGATDHLTGNILPDSISFSDSSLRRMIGTTWHSRGLYLLDDDAYSSSISRTSLLSSYFTTFEKDYLVTCAYELKNTESLFPSNPISQPNLLRLSIVMFGDHPRDCYHTIEMQFYTRLQSCGVTMINRHLLEVARFLTLSTSLPSYLWGDAVLTAAHLINCMSSRVIHLQTPLDYLKESYPFTRFILDVSHQVFGCTTYVHNHDSNQTKFTPRAQTCMFVGYPLHQ